MESGGLLFLSLGVTSLHCQLFGRRLKVLELQGAPHVTLEYHVELRFELSNCVVLLRFLVIKINTKP